MKTNRTLIIAVLINLVCLCFSGSIMADQHGNGIQPYSDYDFDTASLASLYPHLADYLWIDKQQPTAQAIDALEFIADSASHGLNPNHYHLDLLQQLEPELNEDEAHLFDLILSDGLLKLVRDMSAGRLDPNVVDPEWSIPRVSFNATAFLQQALTTNKHQPGATTLVTR